MVTLFYDGSFFLLEPQRRAIFTFNDQYYGQIDGVAMGSPFGPVLTNIFMCDFEDKWVLNNTARPSIWFRYVELNILKWDHFDILAKRRSDTHCKIKETLLIRELKPTLNDTVSSEKLCICFMRIVLSASVIVIVN